MTPGSSSTTSVGPAPAASTEAVVTPEPWPITSERAPESASAAGMSPSSTCVSMSSVLASTLPPTRSHNSCPRASVPRMTEALMPSL